MKKLLFLLFTAFLTTLQAQKIYYVNQNVQGGQETGATWADAFSDLQQALTAVQYGDEIWIAAGIYLPTASRRQERFFPVKKRGKNVGWI